MWDEIKIEGLSKRFGKKIVFDDFHATIKTRRIIGLLGENGIGKTTLLRIMAGLLYADKGYVFLGEYENLMGARSLVSYLLDPSHFYSWMRVRDAIAFYEDFFLDFNKQKAIDFCDEFQLNLNDKIKSLSKGEQEKVSIFMNLSRETSLYLMDEPAGGFDPKFKKEILKIILQSMDEKRTIILSTHLLKDFEHVFDDVLILKKKEAIYTSCDAIREAGKSVENYYLEVVANEL